MPVWVGEGPDEVVDVVLVDVVLVVERVVGVPRMATQ